MGDKQLRQDIIDELEYEPSIDARNIGVAVSDRVVTLTGHVSTYAERLAAERAVRRVSGVRAIAEEIEVRHPNDQKPADNEIAKRVADVLEWDSQVPRDTIQIKVQNGWVTLTGEVDWQYQRKAAEDDVRKLSGVTGVGNQISIKPGVDIPDIKSRIEQALKRSAEIEAKAIRVSVQDGKVTLEGRVHNWYERDAVETAAWSAPGVNSVEDRLIVS